MRARRSCLADAISPMMLCRGGRAGAGLADAVPRRLSCRRSLAWAVAQSRQVSLTQVRQALPGRLSLCRCCIAVAVLQTQSSRKRLGSGSPAGAVGQTQFRWRWPRGRCYAVASLQTQPRRCSRSDAIVQRQSHGRRCRPRSHRLCQTRSRGSWLTEAVLSTQSGCCGRVVAVWRTKSR